jgi:phospholipid transport system substrate-binding protein
MFQGHSFKTSFVSMALSIPALMVSSITLTPGGLLSPVIAEAADTVGSTITITIKALQDAVTAGEKQPAAEVDATLRKILAPVFDFSEMARSSLGSNWNKGTPEQQKEFVDLFSERLAKTYLKRIKDNVKDADYHLLKETVDGEHGMVQTTVIDKGDKIRIDYRMIHKEGSWRVYDVVIESVGLVTNFRNEFGTIVRKEGFDGLLKRLRDKVAESKAS